MQVSTRLRPRSIDRLRAHRGETLQEVAEALGVSYDTVRRANLGRPVQPGLVRRLREWLIATGEDPGVLRDMIELIEPESTPAGR